jgi:hypothetical protein
VQDSRERVIQKKIIFGALCLLRVIRSNDHYAHAVISRGVLSASGSAKKK